MGRQYMSVRRTGIFQVIGNASGSGDGPDYRLVFVRIRS